MRRYVIHVKDTKDKLNAPWPIIVQDVGDGPLVVQDKHPLEGDTLIGFETEFGKLDVTVLEPKWFKRAVGMKPVFIDHKAGPDKIGMYAMTKWEVYKIINESNLDKQSRQILT